MRPSAIRKLKRMFWWIGKNMLPPIMRLNGISELSAKMKRRPAYFFRFLVWKYPSTSRNANIGSAKRQMHVSHSFPETIVPQRWSHSINAIAKMWRVADVVSNLNFVISYSFCIFSTLQDFCLSTASINVYNQYTQYPL